MLITVVLVILATKVFKKVFFKASLHYPDTWFVKADLNNNFLELKSLKPQF